MPDEDIPTGYLEVPEPLAFDKQALEAIQTMMHGYDGSVPFPDYLEQYMQAWEKRILDNPEDEGSLPYFNLRPLQYFVFPPNDPRRQKHDGILKADSVLSSDVEVRWGGSFVVIESLSHTVVLDRKQAQSLLA